MFIYRNIIHAQYGVKWMFGRHFMPSIILKW